MARAHGPPPTFDASVAGLIAGALGVAILYRFLELQAFLLFGGLIVVGYLYQTYKRNMPMITAMLKESLTPAERFDQTIPDHGWSLEQIEYEIEKASVEMKPQVIVGIDLTGSNTKQGEATFKVKGRKIPNLHSTGDHFQNPYQYVLATLKRTLSKYDEDGMIPAFGFGDLLTKHHSVRNLDVSSGTPHATVEYTGFDGVLQAYTRLINSNTVTLSGPTSFAPLIRRAIEITRKEAGYHILIIITDGDVTMVPETASALQEASNYPLSIIVVGVGDGPFSTMETFDDDVYRKKFDNVQFVSWKDHITDKNRRISDALRDDNFARDALQEIPKQMHYIQRLGLLSNCDEQGREKFHECVQVIE